MKVCPFCGCARAELKDNVIKCRECGIEIEYDNGVRWDERAKVRYAVVSVDKAGEHHVTIFKKKEDAEKEKIRCASEGGRALVEEVFG